METGKLKYDVEIVQNAHRQSTPQTDSKIDPRPYVHTRLGQSAGTNRTVPLHTDAYYMIGWTVGVVLALLVAIVLVNGVILDVATLGVMLPVMLGSALAAMASLV